MRDWERRVLRAGERGWDRRWGIAGVGDAGILDLFSRFVNREPDLHCYDKKKVRHDAVD
jgi:hypothetical protein